MKNLPEVVKQFGSESRKIYADIYIDDHNRLDFTPFFVSKGINYSKIHIENVFGFTLHNWQVKYLTGESDYVPTDIRGCGKSFIYSIKLLLTYREEPIVINRDNCHRYSDEFRGMFYALYFYRNLVELNNKLVAAGFKTYVIIGDNKTKDEPVYYPSQNIIIFMIPLLETLRA